MRHRQVPQISSNSQMRTESANLNGWATLEKISASRTVSHPTAHVHPPSYILNAGLLPDSKSRRSPKLPRFPPPLPPPTPPSIALAHHALSAHYPPPPRTHPGKRDPKFTLLLPGEEETMDTLVQSPSLLRPPTGLEGLESVTLTRFVLQGQRQHQGAHGELTMLLASVQLACKVTETCVRRAGIAKLYGLAGSGNVQGEHQKKLDVIANDTFKVNIDSSEKCCLMVSEEEEEPILSGRKGSRGKYAIAFDPLDGSSNIDANVSIGSIFSIYKIDSPEQVTTTAQARAAILQPGTQMVAAGYAMYGSATNLVITTGEGVHGFTLDPSLGEFVLTHPDIKIPRRGKIYSVNEGNAKHWDKATTEYVNSLKYPEEGKKSYSLRYIGSMVADVHRTLFYGGIFIYPADNKSPNGKLRLLYEAAPMAMLVEQAGGRAITGTQDIMDVVPTDIHQRVPVYMGSSEDVTDFEKFLKQY